MKLTSEHCRSTTVLLMKSGGYIVARRTEADGDRNEWWQVPRRFNGFEFRLWEMQDIPKREEGWKDIRMDGIDASGAESCGMH